MANDGFVEVGGGVRLYYRLAGEGAQTVIVPLECWTADLDGAARGRRILYYDPRGRGRSSAVTDLATASFQQDLDDLDAVRQHFGLAKVALIGWSYYGGVAARYAMDHPDKVERLVMMGALPARRKPFEAETIALEVERRAKVDPAVIQELMAPGTSGARRCAAMWQVFQVTRMGRAPAGPLRGNPCQYPNEWNFMALWRRLDQSLGDWDLRGSAHLVTAPALVIHGLADTLPLAAAEEWARLLPTARLFTIEGVGHFPAVEDPARLFTALDPFLRGDWPAGAQHLARAAANTS